MYHLSLQNNLHEVGIKSRAKLGSIYEGGLTHYSPFIDMCSISENKLTQCSYYYQALKRLSIFVVEGKEQGDQVASLLKNYGNVYAYRIKFPLEAEIYQDPEYGEGYYGVLIPYDFEIHPENIEKYDYEYFNTPAFNIENDDAYSSLPRKKRRLPPLSEVNQDDVFNVVQSQGLGDDFPIDDLNLENEESKIPPLPELNQDVVFNVDQSQGFWDDFPIDDFPIDDYL